MGRIVFLMFIVLFASRVVNASNVKIPTLVFEQISRLTKEQGYTIVEADWEDDLRAKWDAYCVDAQKCLKICQELDGIADIERGEFEEEKDYEVRLKARKEKIATLENERDSMVKRLGNDFSYDMRVCRSCSPADIKLKRFDINARGFPCWLNRRDDVHLTKECDGTVLDFFYKEDCAEFMWGSFKAVEDAKLFKQDFESHKRQVPLNFTIKIRIEYVLEDVLIEPGRIEVTNGWKLSKTVAMRALYHFLAGGYGCMPGEDGDDGLKNVAAKYKKVPKLLVDCKIQLVYGGDVRHFFD